MNAKSNFLVFPCLGADLVYRYFRVTVMVMVTHSSCVPMCKLPLYIYYKSEAQFQDLYQNRSKKINTGECAAQIKHYRVRNQYEYR
jgi:hypothetical protein